MSSTSSQTSPQRHPAQRRSVALPAGDAGPHTPVARTALQVAFVAEAHERHANGGLNSLFELVSRLPEGHSCMLTASENPLWRRWEQAGIPVHRLLTEQSAGGDARANGRGRGKWTAQFAWRLSRRFAQHRPDVVVCNDIRSMLAAGPVCRWHRIPLVFFVRDIFEPGKRYGWKWRFAASCADQILCLSDEMSAALESRLATLRGRKPRVEKLYSIVDFDRMHPAGADDRARLRTQLGIAEDEFAVCYAAGVCDKKNQLELIPHLPKLFAEEPRARVHFLGDFAPDSDAYSRACADAVKAAGIEDKVVFHGYCREISAWYRAADCGLLASRREGLARCMIESLACGTPVVSFDVTSAREILQPCDAHLVASQGDYQQLLGHVARLAQDELLRESIGARGATLARRLFDPQHAIARLTDLLQRVAP